MLVPPIYAKQLFIQNFMAPVWHDAHGALAACDRVVLFGYSLPPLDIEAEKDFQRAIAQNVRLSHIDVINPDTAAASRYAAAFPRLSVHWYHDLGRFLHTNPF